MKESSFELTQQYCRVQKALDVVRDELGVTREVFADLTIAQVIGALGRETHCGLHKGVRNLAECSWCRMLDRNDKKESA